MRVLFFLVLVAGVIAALLYTWQASEAPPPETPAATAELPRYSVTGVQWLRLDRQGEPEFRAKAEALDWYADESATLRKVELDALGGYSSPWHVEAPAGRAPAHERQLQLTGGVEASGALASERVAVTTPKLWVDLLRHELRTDERVVLKSDFRNATARGLRTDFAGEHVQLLNDVQVDYAPDS